MASTTAPSPYVLDRDECVQRLHAGWSVQVVGTARTLTDPDELAWAKALPLRPWAYGGHRPFWVRIDPSEITGRRFG